MHLKEHHARLEELSEGLGTGFDEDVHRALGQLASFPEIGARYHGRVRRYILRRWHFGIFYTVTGNRVAVAAALDLRQDPDAILRLIGLP